MTRGAAVCEKNSPSMAANLAGCVVGDLLCVHVAEWKDFENTDGQAEDYCES